MDGDITQGTGTQTSLCEAFDVPEESNMNNNIVDGLYYRNGEKAFPLGPFTAHRVYYSFAL